MRNLFLKSLLVIGVASAIVACSKDEENAAPAPTFVGKWNVNSEITRTILGTNVLRNDTSEYPANFATFEFNSSSSMFANVGGMLDTLEYSYVNGKLRIIDFDPIDGNDTSVFNKVTLSASSAIITDLDTTVTANGLLISEYTINMSK